MARTYLDLCKQFRQEVGMSGTGPTSVDAQVGDMKRAVDWVRKADFEIQRLWSTWNFLWAEGTINVSAGTSNYALTIRPIPDTLFFNDDTPVALVDWRAFQQIARAQSTGTPTLAAVDPAGRLRLWPTPDAAGVLTFEGHGNPVEMTGNASQSLIPEKHRDVIIYRAKMYYAEFENAPEVMQSAIDAYREALARLQAEELPMSEATVGYGRGGEYRVVVE